MKRARSTGLHPGAIDLAVRFARTGDGRLEGTLHRSDQVDEIVFSGTLEFLKALETALGDIDEAPR